MNHKPTTTPETGGGEECRADDSHEGQDEAVLDEGLALFVTGLEGEVERKQALEHW